MDSYHTGSGIGGYAYNLAGWGGESVKPWKWALHIQSSNLSLEFTHRDAHQSTGPTANWSAYNLEIIKDHVGLSLQTTWRPLGVCYTDSRPFWTRFVPRKVKGAGASVVSILCTWSHSHSTTTSIHSLSGVSPGVTGGGRAASLMVRSVFEPADEPCDDHREHRQDAGHRQANGSRRRGGDAVAVHEDQAHEEQHQHGQKGEDHAHAAGGQRHPLAALAAVVAHRVLGEGRGGGHGGGRRRVADVGRPRRLLPAERDEGRVQRRRVGRQGVLRQRVRVDVQREILRHLCVVGQVLYPVVRHRGAVATDRAADAPWPLLPEVQRVQTLLAERVQALQDLRGPAVKVEVIVADLALVLLVGERRGGLAGGLRSARGQLYLCHVIFRHSHSPVSTKGAGGQMLMTVRVSPPLPLLIEAPSDTIVLLLMMMRVRMMSPHNPASFTPRGAGASAAATPWKGSGSRGNINRNSPHTVWGCVGIDDVMVVTPMREAHPSKHREGEGGGCCFRALGVYMQEAAMTTMLVHNYVQRESWQTIGCANLVNRRQFTVSCPKQRASELTVSRPGPDFAATHRHRPPLWGTDRSTDSYHFINKKEKCS